MSKNKINNLRQSKLLVLDSYRLFKVSLYYIGIIIFLSSCSTQTPPVVEGEQPSVCFYDDADLVASTEGCFVTPLDREGDEN